MTDTTKNNADISDVRQVFETLENLKNISSNNERKETLKTILESDDLSKRTIAFLLNKFQITHMAKAKFKKDVTTIKTNPKKQKAFSDWLSLVLGKAEHITTFDQFLKFVSNNPSGTDESIKIIKNYAETLESDVLRQFIIDIASKSYKIHVNAKSYNDIAKELNIPQVPDFAVQLAKNIDDSVIQNKLSKDKESLGLFYITEKFDGVRCIAFIKNGSVQLFKRSGREITDAPEITEELLNIFGNSEHVLDGELLITNSSGRAEDAFRETMTIVGSKDKKIGLTYHVFDELTSVDRFLTQDATRTYELRRNVLESLSGTLNKQPHLRVVDYLYYGNNIDEAYRLRDEIVDRGGEGVMLNTADSIYQFKRTGDLLKLKQLSENDGVIKGVYEGEGENTGRLGGIQITYKDTIINIGSGFSRDERIDYWAHPEKLIGKVASYKFTTESTDQNQDTNVRFGRWKGLRPDKSAKDVSYDN